MDAKDIDALAEAIVKKQAEAAEKKAAAEAAAAEKLAKEAAVAAEKAAKEDAKRAAKDAAEAAERDRIAAEVQARIDGVLSAAVGSVFVDADGAKHRVVGRVGDGIDTVSRDADGAVVGNWRSGKNTAVLATWRKA